jgi:hypothetical protein
MANPFTTNLQRLHTQAWQNEFPNATAATYSAKERKWRHFCHLSEHNPATTPSQELVELFITWLSHTAKNGSPMARTSVKQYVGRIATATGQQFPDTVNAFHSLRTARYLKLTLRWMPKAKQRARPIELAHLERLRLSSSPRRQRKQPSSLHCSPSGHASNSAPYSATPRLRRHPWPGRT